jgi:hypothetical protein
MGNNIKNQNDFYIGWMPDAPDNFSKKIKRFILVLAFVVPLVSAMLVLGQRGFVDAVFEFGKSTQLEGILVKIPVPMIKIKDGLDENGKQKFQSILLVGFGKTGADSTLNAIEKEQNRLLENEIVTLKGTLIYYNGKKVLELTEGTKSFISFGDFDVFSGPREMIYSVTKYFGDVRLKGEIYDPKCAFGVMKPGFGKPHRSCAVRCISGGVPPILRIKDEKGEANYLILVGSDGQAINEDVLDFVADQVLICGRLEQKDDWLVLYINPTKDILRLQPYWMDGEVPLCGDL